MQLKMYVFKETPISFIVCEQELQTFLCSLNEFHTDINLKVSVKNSKIITDLYVKSTDRYQYFHYLSAHPNHTKRSVVFGQTFHISWLCSYGKLYKT